ncbi:MAG: TlpA family protein disulfide reductase [Melioribacteraceae bacterium]|nr:TlpA family protein disulfide reductase [Melioribacteraceae bacterium]
MKFRFLAVIFIALVAVACSTKEPLPEKPMEEVRKLYKEDKVADALNLVNRVIEEKGEDKNTSSWKYHLLTKLEKYDEALILALSKDEKDEKKSPWNAMDVVECNLKLDKNEEANKWFAVAVERGFKSLSMLDGEPFDTLKTMAGYADQEKIVLDALGIGAAAKDFTLTNINGEEIKLSAMKGKVVLVDFWATWCAPCRAEIPNMVKVYEEYKDKGFEIIGISLDNENHLEKLKEFLVENKMEWPITYSAKGWKDETAQFYGVNSIPSTWLVDKNGVLRYFDVRGEDLKVKLEELL